MLVDFARHPTLTTRPLLSEPEVLTVTVRSVAALNTSPFRPVICLTNMLVAAVWAAEFCCIMGALTAASAAVGRRVQLGLQLHRAAVIHAKADGEGEHGDHPGHDHQHCRPGHGPIGPTGPCLAGSSWSQLNGMALDRRGLMKLLS
jgi:hypothetical protein